jgi:hypothetical protein
VWAKANIALEQNSGSNERSPTVLQGGRLFRTSVIHFTEAAIRIRVLPRPPHRAGDAFGVFRAQASAQSLALEDTTVSDV